jgi:hypothetical protein
MENVYLERGIYKHYKGKLYEVIGVARHSETLEVMVVYKATYQKDGENLWVRPLSMFTEKIMIGGKEINRFSKL